MSLSALIYVSSHRHPGTQNDKLRLYCISLVHRPEDSLVSFQLVIIISVKTRQRSFGSKKIVLGTRGVPRATATRELRISSNVPCA